jgi:hypothetical protein
MQVQFNNVTLNGTAQVGSVPFFVSDLFTNGETGVWGDNLDPAMMFAADTAVTATALSGVVTWNGSTVRLYLDGVEVYSGAQPGEVNTMVPMNEGALNQNGTAESFFAGTISQSLNRAMRPVEIQKLHGIWNDF